jgi:hypothetical protein
MAVRRCRRIFHNQPSFGAAERTFPRRSVRRYRIRRLLLVFKRAGNSLEIGTGTGYRSFGRGAPEERSSAMPRARPIHVDPPRATGWLGAYFLGALLFVACVGPATTFPVYESKAVVSVEQAVSSVQTVRVAISQSLDDRNFAPFLSETMNDAEEDVTTAEGHFSSIQPPDAPSIRLRNQATALLHRASDAVERARIAIRSDDVLTLQGLNRDLPRLVSALNRFAVTHR